VPAVPLHLSEVPTTLDAAHSLLDQAEDLRTTRYISPILLALTANFAKDTESLFIWLNVAYDERSVQLPYLLRSPALPQSDPRLIALIRRLKLPANP
jgi:hypothetical protein